MIPCWHIIPRRVVSVPSSGLCQPSAFHCFPAQHCQDMIPCSLAVQAVAACFSWWPLSVLCMSSIACHHSFASPVLLAVAAHCKVTPCLLAVMHARADSCCVWCYLVAVSFNDPTQNTRQLLRATTTLPDDLVRPCAALV
jgi:hypothetical protein